MGVGSSYITLQTYGGTLLGFVIVIGGGLGLVLTSSVKGKVISGAIILVGLAIMFTSSKIRKSSKEDEGFEGVGVMLLGFAAIGVIGRIFSNYMRPPPPAAVVKVEPTEEETDSETNDETEV